jgi:hypothetical protein
MLAQSETMQNEKPTTDKVQQINGETVRLSVVGYSFSIRHSTASALPWAAGAAVRSRYEITCPFIVISLRLLMPFPNFSGQVIL